MATRKQVMEICGVLAAAFPTFDLKKATIDVYADTLMDLDADLLATAAKQAIAECKFFPSVAELRERVHTISKRANDAPDLDQAWALAKRYARNLYERATLDIQPALMQVHPLVARTVEAFGYERILQPIVNGHIEDESTLFAQFRDVFNAASRRAESEARQLPATNQLIKQLAQSLDARRVLEAPTAPSRHRTEPVQAATNGAPLQHPAARHLKTKAELEREATLVRWQAQVPMLEQRIAEAPAPAAQVLQAQLDALKAQIAKVQS